MSQEEMMQLKVNRQTIGLIGLKRIMEEMAAESAHRSDSEVQTELMRRVSKMNYIPEHAKDAYRKALFKEFNRFLGRPYEDEEEVPGGLEIKILGPGCARCEGLEREVMAVASDMGLPAAIEHVRDMKEIARYGVMGTPALVINSKVVSVGTVPGKAKIKEWFRELV